MIHNMNIMTTVLNTIDVLLTPKPQIIICPEKDVL